MKNKILIIEDNADLLDNTTELLEIAGYEVITATNGKEGLELAHKNKPDLILCDIMMPVLDGYGVLRATENIPELAGTPFVFITAKSEKADFRKGMDLGADDYLTKPFNGTDLLRVVSARLTKNKRRRDYFENNITGLNELYNEAKNKKGVSMLSENRKVKKIRKKDMLFMEGDSPSFVYFIISGKIKLFKSNESGKEFIVEILKEGDFLGYLPLLENSKHKESAMAIDNAEVALIPSDEFFALLHSNQEIAITFIKMMSNNFSEAEEKLLQLAYDSARKRVAEAIIYVSKKYQENSSDELSFTLLRENISSLSGISPESVSRNLTDFREEGLIETNNGTITILNLKKLESMKN